MGLHPRHRHPPASPQCSCWVKEDRCGVHHPRRKDRGTFKSAGSIVQWRSVGRWTWNRATLGRVIIAHHGGGFWCSILYPALFDRHFASAQGKVTPTKSGNARASENKSKDWWERRHSRQEKHDLSEFTVNVFIHPHTPPPTPPRRRATSNVRRLFPVLSMEASVFGKRMFLNWISLFI